MATQNIECMFCHISKIDSFKMVVGPNDFTICDKCILELNKLINTNPPVITPIPENKAVEIKEEKFSSQLNSVEIKNFLDKHVIGQETAKMALSVSVVNHYKRMLYENDTEIDKSNLIITGPSGSGKSLLIKTVAKFLNVPFITVDATTLTEAGYIGENVDTIISRLLLAADGDIEAAETGIVFIDEIDKIASGRGRSGTNDNRVAGIQSALLKMVEGSEVRVPLSGTSKKSFMPRMVEVNTKNILFICGGAFTGMNELVTARLKQKKGLGFTDSVIPQANLEDSYTTEDFIEFGMLPEFIGRFPLKTHTNELSSEELIKVLTDVDNSILDQFKFYFDIDEIELEFTPEFISGVAEKTKKEKTGVRGLRGVCDDIMLQHLFLLPEYKKRNIARITFTERCLNKNVLPDIEVYEDKKTLKNS